MRSSIILPAQLFATAWLTSGHLIKAPVTILNTILPAEDAIQARAGKSECRLPAVADVYLSLGFSDAASTVPANCAPSTGALKGFMLFVDFSDQPADATDSPQNLYNVLVPEASQWYGNASYGKLDLQVDADKSKFYRMPQSAESYNFQRGLSFDDHERYILDAIDAYETSVGKLPLVDVFYVVPARSASRIPGSVAYMATSLTSRSGSPVAKKAVTFGQDAFNSFGFKTLNHETGHSMCLPDLYVEGASAQELTGGYDMMAWINGQSPDYFAWMKWKLNWISDEQVDCVTTSGSTTHTLYPLERKGDEVKAVVVKRKGTDTQALVAEVRTNEGVNGASCVTGVLLYTVDTKIATIEGSVTVLDAKPGSIGCDDQPKNDAVLTNGTSYDVAGWGLKVTVTGQVENVFTIRLDYS